MLIKRKEFGYNILPKALDVVEAIPTNNLTELQKTRYFYLLIFHNMNMGNSYSFYHNPPQMDRAEHYFLKTLSFAKSHQMNLEQQK